MNRSIPINFSFLALSPTVLPLALSINLSPLKINRTPPSDSSPIEHDEIVDDFFWTRVPGEWRQAADRIDCVTSYHSRTLEASFPHPSQPSTHPRTQNQTTISMSSEGTCSATYTCHVDSDTSTISAVILCGRNPDMVTFFLGEETADPTSEQ